MCVHSINIPAYGDEAVKVLAGARKSLLQIRLRSMDDAAALRCLAAVP